MRKIVVEILFSGNQKDKINEDVKPAFFERDDSINTNEIMELMQYGGLHNHSLFHSIEIKDISIVEEK